MKKIAVVSTSVAIEGEKGLNRMFFLSNLIAQNGYEVELITGTFQHWTKSFREDVSSRQFGNLKVVFLPEDSYRKNIDFRRMISHYRFANRVSAYLKERDYDLVYCDIPDNHVSRKAGEYAKSRNIPFIVDIEDLWPEAMRMVLDIPVVSDILFSYFSIDAKKTYRLASGVVGSSDSYRDEPLKYGVNIDKKVTVYVGNDMAKFDAGVTENAAGIKKSPNEIWVTYAGSLGSSYDIATLIKAGKKLEEKGYDNVKIMILGDGPLRSEWEQLSKSLDANVEFKGYLPFGVMAAYLSKSDFVVNSIVKKASQSFVSKISDYLASGKPMINTCMDKEFWKKVETDRFGINVEAENVDAMVSGIEGLLLNRTACDEMGLKARAVGEKEFDRKISYQRIIGLIKELLGE